MYKMDHIIAKNDIKNLSLSYCNQMKFFLHKFQIRAKISGFTLIELIAVLAIISVLAAVSLPRFMDLSSTAGSQALLTAVSELNSRENLLWAKIKTTPSGWMSDQTLFAFFDATLGDDYKWNSTPTIDGGVLQFKDQTADLQRDASTESSPGSWQFNGEWDGNNEGKKDKNKNKDKGNNGKKNGN